MRIHGTFVAYTLMSICLDIFGYHRFGAISKRIHDAFEHGADTVMQSAIIRSNAAHLPAQLESAIRTLFEGETRPGESKLN